jgi:hypothetical protein
MCRPFEFLTKNSCLTVIPRGLELKTNWCSGGLRPSQEFQDSIFSGLQATVVTPHAAIEGSLARQYSLGPPRRAPPEAAI